MISPDTASKTILGILECDIRQKAEPWTWQAACEYCTWPILLLITAFYSLQYQYETNL